MDAFMYDDIEDKMSRKTPADIHRDNMIFLAKECIMRQDWEQAAQIALQLIKIEAPDPEADDIVKDGVSDFPISHSVRNTLLESWRVVTELCLRFPKSASPQDLLRYTNTIYKRLPLAEKRIIATDSILNANLVLYRPDQAIMHVYEWNSGSPQPNQMLHLGLLRYQLWLKSLREDLVRGRGRGSDDAERTVAAAIAAVSHQDDDVLFPFTVMAPAGLRARASAMHWSRVTTERAEDARHDLTRPRALQADHSLRGHPSRMG